MRKISFVFFTVGSLLGCSDGGGSSGPSGEQCIPGATAVCGCTNGTMGAQTCGRDGSYGRCTCAGPDPFDVPGEGGASSLGGGGRSSQGAAAGERVQGGDRGEGAQGGQGNSESDAGEAGAPSVDDLADCGALPLNFSEDTTLAEGCYTAHATPSMAEGTVLTIGPGVTIRFAEGAGLIVREGRGLVAHGTRELPILLTALEKKPGFWQGILFEQAKTQGRLRHVTIEYGGGQGVGLEDPHPRANLVALDSENDVTVQDCTLRNSAGFGAAFDNFSITSFNRNTVTGNAEAPVSINADQADRIDASNDLTGNRMDVFYLTYGAAAPIASASLPYFVPAYRTIFLGDVGPNTKFLMGRGSKIEVPVGARWLGTKAEPIVLTGWTQEPGFWSGVWVTNDGTNSFVQVVIEYAGSTPQSGNFNIGTGARYGVVTASNSIFQHSGAYGIWQTPDARGFTSIANTFVDNASGDTNVYTPGTAGASGVGGASAGGSGGR